MYENDGGHSLMNRIKRTIAERRVTFRTLVISALEKSLDEQSAPFKLRDVSVGEAKGKKVSSESINMAIDDQRDSNE